MDFNKFNFDIDINFDENEENEETIKKLFLGKVSFFHHACRIQYQNIISVKLMSNPRSIFWEILVVENSDSIFAIIS